MSGRLTAAQARQRMRELVVDSANLVWTDHIELRMAERGIDSNAVLQILRTGDVDDEPEESLESPGDWKSKVTRKMPTGRVAGVVVAITRLEELVLITAEWEDLS
jgi:FAD synthase